MSLEPSGAPRPTLGPDQGGQGMQSVGTPGAMPQPRAIETQGSREEAMQPAIDPAVESGVESGVDPVAEEVVATVAQDDVAVEQAAAHRASPELTTRIAELTDQQSTLEAGFAAQRTEIQNNLGLIAQQEESGDLSPHEASRARETLYDQRASLAEQAAMERSVLIGEIKGLEAKQSEAVANYRKPIAEDPQFVSWAQSPEGQAALDDPRNQAVFGGSPAGPYTEWQLAKAREEIGALTEKLNAQSLTVAAAADNENLNKINAGAGTLPSKVPTTNKPPNARTDPQGYQAHLASYFSA